MICLAAGRLTIAVPSIIPPAEEPQTIGLTPVIGVNIC